MCECGWSEVVAPSNLSKVAIGLLGGVPKFVVYDNLKAAVINPDRYDPGLNRTYAEMASHYGTRDPRSQTKTPEGQGKG